MHVVYLKCTRYLCVRSREVAVCFELRLALVYTLSSAHLECIDPRNLCSTNDRHEGPETGPQGPETGPQGPNTKNGSKPTEEARKQIHTDEQKDGWMDGRG